MSERYAVIGNPIDFSKSPVIHDEFARATGEDIEYIRILGPLGGFAGAVDAFRARGGRGLNVTAPFKIDAFHYCQVLSPSAQLAGAVNCLKLDGEVAAGENFDGVGLVRDVVHNLRVPLAGRRILLLGAGGAARGALLPFLREKPELLVIVNRTQDKARALAAVASSHAQPGTTVEAAGYGTLGGERFDLVFNATSASLVGQALPLDASVFRDSQLAYELAYGKGLTPFLRTARAGAAVRLCDGVGMLAEQAAEAFAWWRGKRPDTQRVIELLRVPLE